MEPWTHPAGEPREGQVRPRRRRRGVRRTVDTPRHLVEGDRTIKVAVWEADRFVSVRRCRDRAEAAGFMATVHDAGYRAVIVSDQLAAMLLLELDERPSPN